MSKGGLENLIALPLQKIPRELGRSVFLDQQMRPYDDQWGYLSSIKRMTEAAADRLISDALEHGDLVGVRFASTEDDDSPNPWTLPPSRKRPEKPMKGPMPASIESVRANLLFIDKKGLPPDLMSRLLRLAAFQNPEFYKAQAMRLATYDKPRVIACGEDLPRHRALPRGCLAEVMALLEWLTIKAVVRDERNAGGRIHVAFHGTLQSSAA